MSQDGHGVMTCSGADYIARLLAVNGIDVVFGMTGGFENAAMGPSLARTRSRPRAWI